MPYVQAAEGEVSDEKVLGRRFDGRFMLWIYMEVDILLCGRYSLLVA